MRPKAEYSVGPGRSCARKRDSQVLRSGSGQRFSMRKLSQEVSVSADSFVSRCNAVWVWQEPKEPEELRSDEGESGENAGESQSQKAGSCHAMQCYGRREPRAVALGGPLLRPKVTTGRRCWSPSVWRGASSKLSGRGRVVVRDISRWFFRQMRLLRTPPSTRCGPWRVSVSGRLCSDPFSPLRFRATDRRNRAALEMLPWHRAEQSKRPRPRGIRVGLTMCNHVAMSSKARRAQYKAHRKMG